MQSTIVLGEATSSCIHPSSPGAIGFRERRRVVTKDGLPHVFATNTLAPYILTALIRPPKRLVYVSSELHRRGCPSLDDLLWERRAWRGNLGYDIMLPPKAA